MLIVLLCATKFSIEFDLKYPGRKTQRKSAATANTAESQKMNLPLKPF